MHKFFKRLYIIQSKIKIKKKVTDLGKIPLDNLLDRY